MNFFHVNGRKASARRMTFARRTSPILKAATAVCLLLPSLGSQAQTRTLSFNAADLPSMTLSLEGASALSRHFSAGLSMQYSPLRGRDLQNWNRQRGVSLSARYWPWNTFSGWWTGSGWAIKEWSTVEGFQRILSLLTGTPGSIVPEGSAETTEKDIVPRPSFPWEEPMDPSPLKPVTEGTAYGMTFSFGYSLMVSKGVNLDFGIGLWGGKYRYSTFSCPRCGRTLSSGDSWFILPYGTSLSVDWVF